MPDCLAVQGRVSRKFITRAVLRLQARDILNFGSVVVTCLKAFFVLTTVVASGSSACRPNRGSICRSHRQRHACGLG